MECLLKNYRGKYRCSLPSVWSSLASPWLLSFLSSSSSELTQDCRGSGLLSGDRLIWKIVRKTNGMSWPHGIGTGSCGT